MSLQSFFSSIKKYQKSMVFRWFLYVLVGCIIYIGLLPSVKPPQLDVEIWSVAKQTISSPRSVEDKEATDLKKKDAVSKVQDQNKLDEQVRENQLKLISSFFGEIRKVKETEATEGNGDTNPSSGTSSMSEKVQKVKRELPKDMGETLSDEVIGSFLGASDGDLERAERAVTTIVNELMKGEILFHQVEEFRKKADTQLAYLNMDKKLKEAVSVLGKYCIVSNSYYSKEATDAMKELAESKVDPVYILEGQIIVKEGEQITKEIYEQLEMVGLLNNENTYQPYIGLLLLVIIFLYLVHHQLKQLNLLEIKDKPHLLLYVIILLIVLGLMKGVSLFQKNAYPAIAYLVPVGVGTMLVALLVHKRLIFVTSILFSIWASILFNEGIAGTLNFSTGIYVLLSSLVAPLFLTNRKRSVMLLRAGLLLAVFNVVLVAGLLLLKSSNYGWQEFGTYVLMAAGSGMVSSVLTIGLVPYLEDGFGMISSLKLIDLASPNHPLLRKILLEAPGTYNHSVMVANLSEVACEAIGADGLLARVGAYYHDIGKTLRPHYFIENQMGMKNPHDSLTPQESKDIIIAHVTDGVEMLRNNHIPNEIVDIAAQHHGTTFLKYFYYKAKENDETVCEDDFRYPGPKAMSKEAAVVGIADSVEAAVRSLTPPTPEKIEALVKSIIKDRLQDGQFSECDLTFKELELVSRALCETLNGTFHSRIKYPEEKN